MTYTNNIEDLVRSDCQIIIRAYLPATLIPKMAINGEILVIVFPCIKIIKYQCLDELQIETTASATVAELASQLDSLSLLWKLIICCRNQTTF